MKMFKRTPIGFVIRLGRLRLHVWREPKRRNLVEVVTKPIPADATTPHNPS
jgi:hypothetical protein